MLAVWPVDSGRRACSSPKGDGQPRQPVAGSHQLIPRQRLAFGSLDLTNNAGYHLRIGANVQR